MHLCDETCDLPIALSIKLYDLEFETQYAEVEVVELSLDQMILEWSHIQISSVTHTFP